MTNHGVQYLVVLGGSVLSSSWRKLRVYARLTSLGRHNEKERKGKKMKTPPCTIVEQLLYDESLSTTQTFLFLHLLTTFSPCLLGESSQATIGPPKLKGGSSTACSRHRQRLSPPLRSCAEQPFLIKPHRRTPPRYSTHPRRRFVTSHGQRSFNQAQPPSSVVKGSFHFFLSQPSSRRHSKPPQGVKVSRLGHSNTTAEFVSSTQPPLG